MAIPYPLNSEDVSLISLMIANGYTKQRAADVMGVPRWKINDACYKFRIGRDNRVFRYKRSKEIGAA